MSRAVTLCAATDCLKPVQPGMLMCREHWFSLPKALRDEVWRTWRAYQRKRDMESMRNYREAVRAAVAYLEVVPARADTSPAADPKPTLATTRDGIDVALARRDAPDVIIGHLKGIGARYRYAHGTYELRVLGVAATCTAGGIGLLRAWQRAAQRQIDKAGEARK